MPRCLKPLDIRNKKTGKLQTVPCGKCPNCMATRASAWSFRLLQEHRASETSQFITLTYDTTSVPITRNGFMGLCKRDLQLFFKRLRKSHEGIPTRENRGVISINRAMVSGTKPIKYYAVGEYGGKYKRPHYHIILFNADMELIQPAWPKGQVHYGDERGVTEASVGYTLKYISKGRQVPMHRNDDRQPEFSLMSKFLGVNYLSENMMKWHKEDLENRVHCVLEGGRKITMPRYYKDKMYSEQEREILKKYHEEKAIEEMINKVLDIEDGVAQRSYKTLEAAIKKQSFKHSIQKL